MCTNTYTMSVQPNRPKHFYRKFSGTNKSRSGKSQAFYSLGGGEFLIISNANFVENKINNFSVFWDLYCAAPERRDTNEHSPEAKMFHEYVSIRVKFFVFLICDWSINFQFPELQYGFRICCQWNAWSRKFLVLDFLFIVDFSHITIYYVHISLIQ